MKHSAKPKIVKYFARSRRGRTQEAAETVFPTRYTVLVFRLSIQLQLETSDQ